MVGEGGISRLRPDGAGLQWTAEVKQQEYLSIATVGITGETVIVDAEFTTGHDLATGAELWTLDGITGDIWTAGDELLAF